MEPTRRPDSMPAPSTEALVASAELSRRIAQRIAHAGGWIGFDAFMRAALYEPGLGYYASAPTPFGEGGDFVTAPGLSPQFGASVAVQLVQWFAEAPDLARRVVEFGAGDGGLAADLLVALDDAGMAPREYAIVELSGALRERQRDTIGRRLAQAGRDPALAEAVRWWDALPESIEGCIVGNELLDAMPVRLFRVRAGQIVERGVAVQTAARHAAARASGEAQARDGAPRTVPHFEYADRPADPTLAAAVSTALDEAMPGWRQACTDPAFDYVSEWPEQALAWVGDIGARLSRGALLLIDYGFPRAEFYHPQRAGGTLMCHRSHHAHPDPFDLPGLQDITAHVDFGAVAAAGEAAGLTLAGFTSQARFLINTGLLDRLARRAPADAVADARTMRAVRMLLSEAEMGELFKAIAFVRGLAPQAAGFVQGDRSGRL